MFSRAPLWLSTGLFVAIGDPFPGPERDMHITNTDEQQVGTEKTGEVSATDFTDGISLV